MATTENSTKEYVEKRKTELCGNVSFKLNISFFKECYLIDKINN
jgi:hypothetical protein